MPSKQEILELIDDIIDHYTPYRPLLDDVRQIASREALLKARDEIAKKKWRCINCGWDGNCARCNEPIDGGAAFINNKLVCLDCKMVEPRRDST
jgi:hypothetical protein